MRQKKERKKIPLISKISGISKERILKNKKIYSSSAASEDLNTVDFNKINFFRSYILMTKYAELLAS
jgi:hypothetical protein